MSLLLAVLARVEFGEPLSQARCTIARETISINIFGRVGRLSGSAAQRMLTVEIDLVGLVHVLEERDPSSITPHRHTVNAPHSLLFKRDPSEISPHGHTINAPHRLSSEDLLFLLG